MHTRTRLLFHVAIVCLSGFSAAHADAPSRELIAILETWDAERLRAMAGSETDPDRKALATALLAGFDGNDAIALASLERLTSVGTLEDGLRFVAFNELGRLDLRNQRYVRAARAFESALVLSKIVAADQTPDVEDDLRYARAHLDVLPMSVTKRATGPVPISRDSLDLPRVSASINGHAVDPIIDTGASHSVVSTSTAKRLGLRRLRLAGGVAADGRPVAARFAVADSLQFAGYEFRNVPFIVLPDTTVSVPVGDGTIGRLEPIIGLSVLRRLDRFEVHRHDGAETLRVGGESSGNAAPNLLLPEGLPVVLVQAGGARLRLSLDTGSNRTSLTPGAIAAHPALAGDAIRERVGMASAAGIASNDAGSIIPALTLHIGPVTTPLARVPVAPGPDNCDGTLGQDVFRSGAGYVIDFERMTLEILPAPAPAAR